MVMGKQGEFKDDVSIPISAEIFDLDDHDLFYDTLQSSEVTCSYEDKKSSYTRTSSSTTTGPNHDHCHGDDLTRTRIYESQQVNIHNNMSASFDHFDFHYSLNDPTSTTTTAAALGDGVVLSTLVNPTVTDPLAGILEEDCMTTSFPAFLRTTTSCAYLDTTTPMLSSFQSSTSLNHGWLGTCICTDSSGLYGGTLLMVSQLQAKEVDFQEDNAAAVIFCPHSFGPYNNSGDLQAFSNKNTELVSGATNSTPNSTEVSSLDESTYKVVGKLSAEQRKEKIHRYLKKRNERNFSKKIKYACRKTLADSRRRVRGRFAKNDEFGEGHRHMNGHNEEDDYDEVNG